jgi:hypothetical protein
LTGVSANPGVVNEHASPAKRPRLAGWAELLSSQWNELARWFWSPASVGALLCGAWLVWRLEPFYGVGVATQDQVNDSLRKAIGSFWQDGLGDARAQGRVFYLLTRFFDLWIAGRPESWGVQAFNIAVFALSAPCFALAVFRSWRERLMYVWLFASVCWASYHHMPPAAYPSLVHLRFLLWPLAALLIRHATRRQSEGSWALLGGFGLLTFLALFQYESAAGMSLCVLGWIVYDTPHPPLRKRLVRTLGIAAFAYLAVYFAWRNLYPPSYDGVKGGVFSLWNVLRVTVAYAVGAFPFSQAYFETIPLRYGDSHVGETGLLYASEVLQTPGLGALLLSGLGLLGLWVSLRATSECNQPPRRIPAAVATGVLAVLMLLAINGPLGLSRKYQDWVRDWDETYLTSQLALYPLVLLGTLLLSAAQRRVKWRGVPLVFLPLVLAVSALSLPVYAHNRRVTSFQRANLARWEEVTALAAYASHIEQPLWIAPDLYYAMYQGEPDWTQYWGRYARKRFGGWLSFRESPPADSDNFALVRLYRFDDGRLRALSVQTPNSVAVVARRKNAPLAIVSETGRAVALDWQRDAEALERSGYSSVTLTEPAELLGPRRRVELVGLWPQTSLAR